MQRSASFRTTSQRSVPGDGMDATQEDMHSIGSRYRIAYEAYNLIGKKTTPKLKSWQYDMGVDSMKKTN